MNRLRKELRPFKFPLLLVLVLGILYFIVSVVFPAFQNFQANKTPIVKISAVNEQIYKQNAKIKNSDFRVKAEHESGKTSVLKSEDFTISETKPDLTGDYTRVEIILKDNPGIKIRINVKNDRTVVATMPCGTPKINSVNAVLYSNGELAFEGEGDVLQYDYDEYPWKVNQDVEIKSVTFEDTVAPTSMDYWFSNISTLQYVDELPKSVESIVGMCQGCIELTSSPEWSRCQNLLDITEAFSECTKLEKITPLMSTIRNATNAFMSCTSIKDAPDMSRAESLKTANNMFSGCVGMTAAETLPPNLEEMNNMFADCINLKKTPSIPGTVKSMEGSFKNNMSLRTVQSIPSGVESIAGCFSGCKKMKGELRIDANVENYNSALSGACNATSLNLTGSSDVLNEIALTNEASNVTVNGVKPVKER